ncbi:MAG: hypothetical protein ACKOS8_19575, partial [Gemmataceae bacterium]
LFVFDPLQDRRFLQEVEQVRGPLPPPRQVTGQYEVLAEAARRVHQLRSGDRSAWPPLLILVSKWDAWHQLLPGVDMAEPLRQGSRAPVAGLDMERIESASDQLRALLLRLCPNLVQTAEAIGHEVRYLPVSALGKTPETRPGILRPSATGGDPGMTVEFIRPRDIHPAWVTVPFLYGLARFVSKLIPKAERREPRDKGPAAEKLVPPPVNAPASPEKQPAPEPPRPIKTKPIEFDFNPEDLR